MKFSAVIALLPLALAAPSQLQRRLPNKTPVNVHGLDTSFTVKCDKTNVDGHDIHKAISWGVNLEQAGNTVGTNKYPHWYGNYNDDSTARFDFLDPSCMTSPNRMEFPIKENGYFEGDKDESPYKFRAIYVFDPNAPYANDPDATYCGTIYHKGKNFEGCDIKKL